MLAKFIIEKKPQRDIFRKAIVLENSRKSGLYFVGKGHYDVIFFKHVIQQVQQHLAPQKISY